jgi:hypothetical protein
MQVTRGLSAQSTPHARNCNCHSAPVQTSSLAQHASLSVGAKAEFKYEGVLDTTMLQAKPYLTTCSNCLSLSAFQQPLTGTSAVCRPAACQTCAQPCA